MGRARRFRAIPSGRESAGALAALVGLSFVWAGMVLGISFLEAPVKFQAPSLSLAVGLDVGRHVFGVYQVPYIGRMRRGSDRLYVATGFKSWGMSHAVVAATSSTVARTRGPRSTAPTA